MLPTGSTILSLLRETALRGQGWLLMYMHAPFASRTSRCNKTARSKRSRACQRNYLMNARPSLDRLVGKRKQLVWHMDTKRFGCFEISHQLVSMHALEGQPDDAVTDMKLKPAFDANAAQLRTGGRADAADLIFYSQYRRLVGASMANSGN